MVNKFLHKGLVVRGEKSQIFLLVDDIILIRGFLFQRYQKRLKIIQKTQHHSEKNPFHVYQNFSLQDLLLTNLFEGDFVKMFHQLYQVVLKEILDMLRELHILIRFYWIAIYIDYYLIMKVYMFIHIILVLSIHAYNECSTCVKCLCQRGRQIRDICTPPF